MAVTTSATLAVARTSRTTLLLFLLFQALYALTSSGNAFRVPDEFEVYFKPSTLWTPAIFRCRRRSRSGSRPSSTVAWSAANRFSMAASASIVDRTRHTGPFLHSSPFHITSLRAPSRASPAFRGARCRADWRGCSSSAG